MGRTRPYLIAGLLIAVLALGACPLDLGELIIGEWGNGEHEAIFEHGYSYRIDNVEGVWNPVDETHVFLSEHGTREYEVRLVPSGDLVLDLEGYETMAQGQLIIRWCWPPGDTAWYCPPKDEGGR